MALTDIEPKLYWTQKIKSDSRVLDPLGIFYHLKIQTDYVPAITSVTRRMRYYTLQAWFFKNMTENDNPHKLERLFILSTLFHHDGNPSHISINHIFNKQYFENDWNTRNSFSLNSDFKISGFGRTYYVRQLERLRCAWHDGLKPHTTMINDDLASTLTLENHHLNQDQISKSDLAQYSKLCICDSETNENEIEVFSKILFGFLNLESPESIEDNIPDKYLDGTIDLLFSGIDDLSDKSIHHELTQRRRNTLFMFMKIIDQVNPSKNEWENTMMNVIYYKQNPLTKNEINFGKLEKIRQYWEVHQYLIYFVFTMESILDILQNQLRKNVDGIELKNFIDSFQRDKFQDSFNFISNSKINQNSSLSNLISILDSKIDTNYASMESTINEYSLMKSLKSTKSSEEKMSIVLVMICLLRQRLDHLPQQILKNYSQSEVKDIDDDINLNNIMTFFDESKSCSLFDFSQKLIEKISRKHLFESSRRYRFGTKNWIFTEEEGLLYPSGRKLVKINDRNNRWGPIYNLLLDTKMIQNESNVTLTEKGKTWMQMIK